MKRIVGFLAALSTIAALAVVHAGPASPQLQDSNAPRQATGVFPSWRGSWVFKVAGTQTTALVALDNTLGVRQRIGPIPIRLDDGSIGTIRVEAGPCGPQESCGGPRMDCGCLEGDSYWILIADSRGRQIRRLHLWAAYAQFQIVPVDLTGGSGDELFIVRMPNRSAPPIGYDIKIWEIDQAAPRNLVNGERVAGYLPGVKMAVSCVLWKTIFLVDPDAAKPRPLTLQIEVSVTPNCPAQETNGWNVDKLQPKELLRFDPARRKYIFPPGSNPSPE